MSRHNPGFIFGCAPLRRSGAGWLRGSGARAPFVSFAVIRSFGAALRIPHAVQKEHHPFEIMRILTSPLAVAQGTPGEPACLMVS